MHKKSLIIWLSVIIVGILGIVLFLPNENCSQVCSTIASRWLEGASLILTIIGGVGLVLSFTFTRSKVSNDNFNRTPPSVRSKILVGLLMLAIVLVIIAFVGLAWGLKHGQIDPGGL